MQVQLEKNYIQRLQFQLQTASEFQATTDCHELFNAIRA